MEKYTRKIWSVLLATVMLAGFFLIPGNTEAKAACYDSYSQIDVIENYSGCTGAQGMTVDDTYIYNVKIASSTSDNAIITRTHRTTGETIYLTNGSDGTVFFRNLYHANDLDIVTVNGVKNLLVATTQKGATSLIRLTLSGTTLTQAAGYTAMSDGTQTTVSSAQVMRVNGTKLEILFKRNKNLFYGTVDAAKSSSQFTITKAFTLDMANVTVNGKVHDMTDWLHQGFDYLDHRIFVPFTSEADASISAIVVYDIQGASGTIRNDPNLSFYIDSEIYASKFEIESCGICPADGKLYFNTNQAKSSSDGNHDAINVINDYVYDPSWGASEPGVYRWEASSGKFQSVTTDGAAYNGLAMSQGSISGTGFTDGRFSLHEGVVLKHDEPWVLQWKSAGNWTNGSLLMSSHNKSNYECNRYLFRRKDSTLIALGECIDGVYHNYGLELSDYGIDGTAEHVYRMTNRLSDDGSNMVYLSVDGRVLGPMNQYYHAGTAQGTTSDWLSGKDFTFCYFGTDSHPIDDCSLEYIQVWGTGLRDYCSHSYAVTGTYETTCQTYAHTCYTCTNCEDSYIVYPEELLSDWQAEKPDVDNDLMETAMQYRYSDYETLTSYETSMEGYESVGTQWMKNKTGTVNYVKTWPSGFSTSNSLYTKYNNKSKKVTASTTDTTKVEINSDKIVGYLYYHWCYSGYPYTSATKTGNYTRFHAYYSTSAPTTANANDTSDDSYRFDSSTACSDSKWYFAVPVYAQKYTTYDCLYTYGRWGTPSEWNMTPIEETDTRQVQTRTVYRYVVGPLGEHNYESVITIQPDCVNPGSKTSVCAVCGHIDTEPVGVIGHRYSTQVVDPTCTQEGSVTVVCTVCADVYNTARVPATGHSFANGSCDICGEADPDYVKPVMQPALILKAPTLEFKDMICVVAFYTAENLEDVVEMGMITYQEQVSEWNIETADHVIPGATYDESTGRYFASSQGIHGKYLADTLYLACYAKLTDGSYVYTKLAPYSPITYATNQLKNSTNSQLKQLVAAMLNYGAAAQTYFGHNTENLANTSLTAEQLALPESYRADMVAAVPAADAAKQGAFVNNRGFSVRKPAVSFEGAFCINYFFTPAYTPAEGITLYYWTEADYNAADVLTVENATGAIAMTDEGGQYRGDIVGIAAKSLSQGIYVAAVYSDGSTTWTSGVLGYSIGAYCANQAANTGTMEDLAKASAVYGYHAKQYFG